MRATKMAQLMTLVLCLVQPLGGQAIPEASPWVQSSLDSRLLGLTKGRWIQLPGRVEGELLAVDDQSLWLLSKGVTRNIPFEGVSDIRVRQHDFDAAKVWTWIGIGAAVTGLGMAAACSSVDDTTGCGGVFVGMALSWAVIGGLFSIDVTRSSWTTVPPSRLNLTRYSRFPQGLPEGYGR